MASTIFDDAHIYAWAAALGVAQDKIQFGTFFSTQNALPGEIRHNKKTMAFLSLISTSNAHEREARHSEVDEYVSLLTMRLNVENCRNTVSNVVDLTGMKTAAGQFFCEVAKNVDEVEIIFNGHGTEEGKLALGEENVNMKDFVYYVSQLVGNYEADCISSFPNVKIIFAQCYGHACRSSEDVIHKKVSCVILATSEQPETVSNVHSTHLQLKTFAESRGQEKEEEMGHSGTVGMCHNQQQPPSCSVVLYQRGLDPIYGGRTSREREPPRVGYLQWDDYFMGVACLTARRSKDPHTKVGACIVGDRQHILGIGYNGMPATCEGSELPWVRNGVNAYDGTPDEDAWLRSKYPYVCHAASNAIQFSSGDLKGSTMYTTLYPANECAKRISQAGIKKVVYLKRDPRMDTATGMTAMLFGRNPQIQLEKFEGKIDLEEKVAAMIAKQMESGPEALTGATGARETNISWNHYHMALACLVADRSKDPNTQVGACIVDDDHKVVSFGWNAMPKGDDSIDWSKDEKIKFVCHAECNALLHKTVPSVKGCTMYVTLHPCNWCAKDIIQAGIKEVIYLSWPESKRNKKEYKASQILLETAKGLKCRPFRQQLKGPEVSEKTDQQPA